MKTRTELIITWLKMTDKIEIRILYLFRHLFNSSSERLARKAQSWNKTKIRSMINRGSYMNVHVLLHLLNELGKRDKMRGLPSILSLFRNQFNKFNNTRARMLDSIYHMTNTLKSHFWRKNVII